MSVFEIKVSTMQNMLQYLKYRLLAVCLMSVWQRTSKNICYCWEELISYLNRLMLINVCQCNHLSFLFFFFLPSIIYYSLCGWTSSGSWRLGQTGWRVWICTPLSRGCWSASTAALWWSGTTRHRSVTHSSHHSLLHTHTPFIFLHPSFGLSDGKHVCVMSIWFESCACRRWWRPLSCATCPSEWPSLWPGNTGSLLDQ